MLALLIPATFVLGTIGVTTQALNGMVGRQLSALTGTMLFLSIGSVLALLLTIATGGASNFALLKGMALIMFLPGAINIALIFTQIHIVNAIGALMTTGLMFFGNLSVSTLLDAVGFLGMTKFPVTPWRLAALGVMAIGIALLISAQRGKPHGGTVLSGPLGPIAAIATGMSLGLAMGINSVMGQDIGTFGATFMFLAPGAILLVILHFSQPKKLAQFRAAVRPRHLLPGVLNVANLCGGLLVIPYLGMQLFTSTSFAASAIGGLTIDRFGLLGLPTSPISRARLLATMFLIAGVVLLLF